MGSKELMGEKAGVLTQTSKGGIYKTNQKSRVIYKPFNNIPIKCSKILPLE